MYKHIYKQPQKKKEKDKMADIKYMHEEKVPFENISKRDGTLAPFDSNRIYNAILKAGTSTGDFSEAEAALLTAQVLKVLKHKFSESVPNVEQIQDVVEQVLISANYFATAKSYMKKWIRKYRGNPRIDELNTINHLHDEEVLQKIKQTRAFWRSKPSMKKMKNYDVFDN